MPCQLRHRSQAAPQESLDLANHALGSAISPGGMRAREQVLDVVTGKQLLEGAGEFRCAGEFRSTVGLHLERTPIWP